MEEYSMNANNLNNTPTSSITTIITTNASIEHTLNTLDQKDNLKTRLKLANDYLDAYHILKKQQLSDPDNIKKCLLKARNHLQEAKKLLFEIPLQDRKDLILQFKQVESSLPSTCGLSNLRLSNEVVIKLKARKALKDFLWIKPDVKDLLLASIDRYLDWRKNEIETNQTIKKEAEIEVVDHFLLNYPSITQKRKEMEENGVVFENTIEDSVDLSLEDAYTNTNFIQDYRDCTSDFNSTFESILKTIFFDLYYDYQEKKQTYFLNKIKLDYNTIIPEIENANNQISNEDLTSILSNITGEQFDTTLNNVTEEIKILLENKLFNKENAESAENQFFNKDMESRALAYLTRLKNDPTSDPSIISFVSYILNASTLDQKFIEAQTELKNKPKSFKLEDLYDKFYNGSDKIQDKFIEFILAHNPGITEEEITQILKTFMTKVELYRISVRNPASHSDILQRTSFENGLDLLIFDDDSIFNSINKLFANHMKKIKKSNSKADKKNQSKPYIISAKENATSVEDQVSEYETENSNKQNKTLSYDEALNIYDEALTEYYDGSRDAALEKFKIAAENGIFEAYFDMGNCLYFYEHLSSMSSPTDYLSNSIQCFKNFLNECNDELLYYEKQLENNDENIRISAENQIKSINEGVAHACLRLSQCFSELHYFNYPITTADNYSDNLNCIKEAWEYSNIALSLQQYIHPENLGNYLVDIQKVQKIINLNASFIGANTEIFSDNLKVKNLTNNVLDSLPWISSDFKTLLNNSIDRYLDYRKEEPKINKKRQEEAIKKVEKHFLSNYRKLSSQRKDLEDKGITPEMTWLEAFNYNMEKASRKATFVQDYSNCASNLNSFIERAIKSIFVDEYNDYILPKEKRKLEEEKNSLIEDKNNLNKDYSTLEEEKNTLKDTLNVENVNIVEIYKIIENKGNANADKAYNAIINKISRKGFSTDELTQLKNYQATQTQDDQKFINNILTISNKTKELQEIYNKIKEIDKQITDIDKKLSEIDNKINNPQNNSLFTMGSLFYIIYDGLKTNAEDNNTVKINDDIIEFVLSKNPSLSRDEIISTLENLAVKIEAYRVIVRNPSSHSSCILQKSSFEAGLEFALLDDNSILKSIDKLFGNYIFYGRFRQVLKSNL